jgi:FG-GAP-like repeat/FG-GAP repeat
MNSSHRTATTFAVVCLMALGMMTLSASAWGAPPAPGFHNPTPLVDDISPTAARLGGGGFILTLRGAGFRPGAEIGWQVGATTQHLAAFVCSPSEIVTWIPYSLVAKAATATVTVINPDAPPLVGKSNPVFLPITKPQAGLAFTEKNIILGEIPNSIVTADFNGDGKSDLAVSEPCGTDTQCNTYHGNVAILLGKGDGTFHAASSPAVDQYPASMAVGDFNGDGKPDIAVLTYVGATVVVLLGKGDGTFTTAPLTPTVGGNPNSIAAGDLNGDGKLDLVVSGYNSLSVLLGKGDGSFTAIAPPTGESQPGGVFLADLNRDGKLDLVLGNGSSPYVSIFLGHGNGTFSAPTSPAAPTSPFAVGDVNRDGKLDLAFSEGNVPGFAQTTISVLLGEGNGQFTAGPPSPVVDNGITGGLLADLNGDGKLDYAAQGGYPNDVYEFFLGDGHGTFNLATTFDVSNNGSGPLVAADFNGDGRLDLATINEMNVGTVSVVLQVPAP